MDNVRVYPSEEPNEIYKEVLFENSTGAYGDRKTTTILVLFKYVIGVIVL